MNKQNYRYWSASNEKRKHHKTFHSAEVNEWAAMSARVIIDPLVSVEKKGRQITVFVKSFKRERVVRSRESLHCD